MNSEQKGFTIGLCTAGRQELRISGRSWEIVPGCLFILIPQQFTESISCSKDFSARTLSASLEAILEHPSPVDINILNITFLHPVIQLREDRAARLLGYYDFIEKRNNDTGNAYHEEISKTLLYALMLEISDIYRSISGDRSEVTKPRQEQLTDDFFKLLTAHYRSEHNVAFYAGRLNRTPKYFSGRLNRTPKYFSEAIRRISGRSVSDWIATMLLSDSKLLLQTTDMTILEISEELGFSSPSVFVQFFRHHTGTTPLQYRKQL